MNVRCLNSGAADLPTVDTLVPEDVTARGENNKEDNPDAEEDERDGAEGDLLQVPAGQCAGPRGQLQSVWPLTTTPLPPQSCTASNHQWNSDSDRVKHRISSYTCRVLGMKQ